jgi:hypothetical protein
MFVCLLRSVHGYPLRAEGLLSQEGGWTWLRSLVLYREDTGTFVGSLPHSSFTESTCKVLRKRGFIKTPRGWRIRTDQYGDYDTQSDVGKKRDF